MRHAVPQTEVYNHSQLSKGNAIRYQMARSSRGDPYNVITRLTKEVAWMFNIDEADAEWIVLHIEEALGMR